MVGAKKRVLLCEGLHEQLFMSHLLGFFNISHSTERWCTLRESGVRYAEMDCIRKFMSSRKYTGIFLLKDEDGKDRCMDTFIELIDSAQNRYQLLMWKGSGDRVPFYLVKSGSAHSVLQMTIYGSGDRVLFYSIM